MTHLSSHFLQCLQVKKKKNGEGSLGQNKEGSRKISLWVDFKYYTSLIQDNIGHKHFGLTNVYCTPSMCQELILPSSSLAV